MEICHHCRQIHPHRNLPIRPYHQETYLWYQKTRRRHGLGNPPAILTDRIWLGRHRDYRQHHRYHNPTIQSHR